MPQTGRNCKGQDQVQYATAVGHHARCRFQVVARPEGIGPLVVRVLGMERRHTTSGSNHDLTLCGDIVSRRRA